MKKVRNERLRAAQRARKALKRSKGRKLRGIVGSR
jgi:hypothetical protein